jgi:tyrosinase
MATFTRANVYAKGGDFSDPVILWYARGVKAMVARKLADTLGWRFYAGIHGFDRPIWTALGHLKAADKLPSSALQKRFWKQCQHGSWYFLPWHRGYLLALEATIRAEVVKLGGPGNWALPYWNYFGPNDQNQLPPAFASPDWPDGKGTNPLYTKQRYGPNNDSDVFVPLTEVNLDALTVPDFTGVASGGDPGFGGVDTGFEHGGSPHGDLETQPHDWVHGLVGGSNPANPNLPGLMSDPDTAGLDPIFYLHHANIDRLWEVWIQGTVSLGNPPEANWIKGPASVGQRVFSMPLPPKGAPWDYTPGQMADLSKLDYTYDDVSSAAAPAAIAALAAAPPEARLERLRGGAKAAGGTAMPTRKQRVELVGANDQPLRISGSAQVLASVQMDEAARGKVSASLAAAAAEETATPDRVFLNLENVRGLNDATAFKVYVNERLAGSVALFGVRKASAADGEHAGEGLTFVLEITKIVDEMHLNNALDVDALDVRIAPVKPVPEEAQVSIGRLSIFRQGE